MRVRGWEDNEVDAVYLNGRDVTKAYRQMVTGGPFGIVELYDLDQDGCFQKRGENVATSWHFGLVWYTRRAANG